MTTEQFIAKAKELRSQADDAETALMKFLCWGEEQTSIWAGTGMSYLKFIEQSGICKAIRYEQYKRVRDGVGEDVIEGVGIHGVVAAGGLKSSQAQRDLLGQIRQWEETNGTKISEQSAERLAREAKIRHIGSANKSQSFLALHEKCERLKIRVQELEAENTALRAELKRLKSKKPAKRTAA